MVDFEAFLKKGEVRLQEKNIILAKALIKSSEKAMNFVKTLKVNDETSEHIISDSYDIMRELIEAKLAAEGYKSYSHEATILFLKKFPQFKESEIDFLDNIRKIRNSIKYYGKESNETEAKKVLSFLNSILPKLKKLIENVK